MWGFIRRHAIVSVVLAIAIIAVLLVIFPVFPVRRGSPSHVSGCMTNLRVLGVAMQAYAADHDERLPNALTWPKDLRPHAGSSRRLHCPSDQLPGERSYEMLQSWSGKQLLTDDDLSRPILLYEIGKFGVEYRHNGGINLGFVDGHCKWFARERVPPSVILRGIAPETSQ